MTPDELEQTLLDAYGLEWDVQVDGGTAWATLKTNPDNPIKVRMNINRGGWAVGVSRNMMGLFSYYGNLPEEPITVGVDRALEFLRTMANDIQALGITDGE